ncbi:calcium-binding protein [Roseicella aquatilis]|uniref:Calcium-binding protein n=1 Tax=Roseicella aquatilis TaxID=2527868 RepID=A0A4R4D454_9PROT|nr:hypothetical protein [Roseicella aquatilis]TCZ52966.1 hypothetical protein EXY23_25420 [Roseicella aquatilis]
MVGVFLGNGDDSYRLTRSPDEVILRAGDGNDTISGSPLPNSLILGGRGEDSITLNLSNNVVVAGGHDGDTIALNDMRHTVVFGDRGDDVLSTTSNRGVEGGNSLFGGYGDDVLTSQSSGSTLSGGDGNDTLTANFAFDNLLDGGKGNDTFVVSGTFFFTAPDTTVEIIGGRGCDTYNFDLGGLTSARVTNDQDGIVSAGDAIGGLKSVVDDYQKGEPIHINATDRVAEPVQLDGNHAVVLQDGEYAVIRGTAGAGLQDAFTVDPGGHDLLLVYDPVGAATTPFVTQVEIVFRGVCDADWLNFV